MCKLRSVCVKLSHLNATPIPASLKGLSVHVDFQLIVRIFDFRFVLVSKFGLLMCSFNGVLVACENSRHSYLGTVFVVNESMWPEEIGSLTPMSRLMHIMLQTSHMRIVLGWVCVIDHLVQRTIPDDSLISCLWFEGCFPPVSNNTGKQDGKIFWVYQYTDWMNNQKSLAIYPFNILRKVSAS